MSGEQFHRRVRLGGREREQVFREFFDDHALEFAARFPMAGMFLHQAQDQVQGRYTRLMEKWESLGGDVPSVHWLSQVASYAIADHFAARGRHSGEPRPAAPRDTAQPSGLQRFADEPADGGDPPTRGGPLRQARPSGVSRRPSP